MPCTDPECPSDAMWPHFLGVVRQYCPNERMTQKQRWRVWKWSKSFGKMISCKECGAQWGRMLSAIKRHQSVVFDTRATVLSFFHDIRNLSRLTTGLEQIDYGENCAYVPVLSSIMCDSGGRPSVPRGSMGKLKSSYSRRLKSELVIADDLTSEPSGTSSSSSSSDIESNTSESAPSPPAARRSRIVTVV